ncbi:carotenoid biosynthesis protein [Mangrovibacterium diazotrophicum]|uniref:Putative membrane protein n=1 Tax=Mangrovibacterium diazotrophicum TaxID=1261403 RepID=A0A419W8M5_9BACT|nr:carotenoid biosynthesis protein [Mangrovibacterium diazotrophicum]RKD91808.1 putative membrane protein [Mangrovibacterium diazotrophicum]
MPDRRKLIWSARIVVAVLYFVGIVGFSLPETEGIFKQLSAWNLLFSFLVLLYFQTSLSVRVFLALLAVAVAGFAAELVGTQTGLLFGHYTYGLVLGLKLWQTPLLIGVNWLVLCYGVFVGLSALKLKWWMPVVGALLMVLFDFVMEPVAIRYDMWSWENGAIPFKNYVDWFLLSYLLLAGMKDLKLNIRNPLAVWIVVCQFLFFLALHLKLNIA